MRYPIQLNLSLLTIFVAGDTEHPHRVINLPGAPAHPSFPLYSGFIDVDIEDIRHSMFYVLCEAIRADPIEAPLVVWLNGGPGASSLLGLFQEHGPYLLDVETDNLTYNDLSLNQYANVLYLETPSGVGFSRANVTFDSYDDPTTAELNLRFLEKFMTEDHPRYVDRDFFITGESYGGVYIPYLTIEILSGLKNGRFTNHWFKGIAMGNALVDFRKGILTNYILLLSTGAIQPRYGAGLIDQLVQESQYWSDDNDIIGKFNYLINKLYTFNGRYNVRLACEKEDNRTMWHIETPSKPEECVTYGTNEALQYLNRIDVQKSLNAFIDGEQRFNWTGLTDVLFKYKREWNTIPLYRSIINATNSDFRILFFTGDLDLACPALMVDRATSIIAKENEFEEIENAPKIWRYLDDFGGAQTSYRKRDNNVTMDVLTVRGSGHFVSINHPSRFFQIINNFLSATDAPIDYSKKIRRRKFRQDCMTMHSRMQLLLAFQFIFLPVAAVVDHPDRVINLPGAPSEPSFPMYAGYITVDIRDARHNIFYVLCEAIHAEPLQSPLVVWLNGGPGASSLIGFLMENGPYKLHENGRLQYNDFSLNQYANVLYIESPSGVGFSRSNKSIKRYHDGIIAELNVNVLENFMTRLHPRYRDRDFFLAGESYAGSYIPNLVVSIYSGLSNGNFTNDQFRGIVIGNACMNAYNRRLSPALHMMAIGIVPQSQELLRQWHEWQGGMVNIDEALALDNDLVATYSSWLFKPILNTHSAYNLHAVNEAEENGEFWHISRPTKEIEWTLGNITERYMNRADVQFALHAIDKENSTRHWEMFNRTLFKAYNYYPYDTAHLYCKIIAAARDDFRMLFYSGDLDFVCSALHVAHGTTIVAERNGFEEIRDAPRIWKYLGDFGGAQSSYRMRNSRITMDVLTVRGSGHFVLTNHPSRAFQIFNNFMFSNETLIDYSQKIRRRKILFKNTH